ncbi:MAG: SIR2 family protein [Candidatus Obscuribacterales bacterium]|nr:SIR2 family protein [Candidatus Obscuribacterales bacterium]
MNLEDFKKFVQGHFTDGLVIIIGSGLSAAEGISGMPSLAAHLMEASKSIVDTELLKSWEPLGAELAAKTGLEEALLRYPPTADLENWIMDQTCSLMLPEERAVVQEVIEGRQLKLAQLLSKILAPSNGLSILTTNYDRLAEIACERAGYHVDTTAVGLYAGEFDHSRSKFMSCRGVQSRGKSVSLKHAPRAIILKPHGSFDWYRNKGQVLRCGMELDLPRAIITPGLNKYKAGYASPFDIHRELANERVRSAAKLMVLGYGFNDDHLQTHLLERIESGLPTLIVTRGIGETMNRLATESPNCVCVGESNSVQGVTVISKEGRSDHAGPSYWDLSVLVQEVL